MKYWIYAKTDYVSRQTKNRIIATLPFTLDKYNPDLVITIGGDGTFLRALHLYPNALFVGVHTGHLGFYSYCSYKDVESLCNSLIDKSYTEGKLPLIECEYKADQSGSICALNEITLISPPRTLIVDVYINDILLEEYRGSGLCVSTPNGSTAYNRSLGGAIIDHKLLAMQLTEMAGLNSSYFETLKSPIVLDSTYKIRLVSASLYKNMLLTADNVSLNLGHFQELTCSIGQKYARVIINESDNFVERIKKCFFTKKKR